MNTEVKTNTRTALILTVMRIVTWVAFIGLMIKAGAILISYGVSCVNPEAARNLYMGLNLHTIRQINFWHYTLSVFFMIALSGMKTFVLFLVIKALSKVNLVNPFTIGVARILEKISYVLLGTWVIVMLNNVHAGWLLKRTGILQEEWTTEEFIFMAGIVFIISQVFKRGVEIQSENDLTV
ncbi:Protein of unknown function (DUF2975) [Chitinophaga niastensis]|uniref:DUF2975 family protein n=1 Tax=Chitinophaga niastensis TaxID=536980 RepID=A0A2P8HJ87_CHINA|nr:DUF2975 domain-containing protein [Chitinophaga niastensis]PSL46279.1 Protein of unknown function (DUF2975) [Chitinophaga niastensis]